MWTGVGLKIAATLSFALMSAMIKTVAGRYPVGEVVFFRSIIAMAVLVVWLQGRGEFPSALYTQRPFGHFGRSIIGSGGMFANFIALSLLPLADATAFTFATPLIVVLLAAFILRESVAPYRWAAVAAGFCGVLIMLSEHLGEGQMHPSSALSRAGAIGALVALAGAVSSAFAMIQTRRLTQSEATGAIVFYFSGFTAGIGALVLLLAALWPEGALGGSLLAGQSFRPPSPLDAAFLTGVGVLGGIGQILMTQSYRHADASVIAAFDYASMLWAMALGMLFFAETPSLRIVCGAIVVVASGVFMLVRSHRGSLIEAGQSA